MKSKILICILLIFSNYLFSQQKDSTAYIVLSVTPNKVLYKDIVVTRKSIIWLKEQPPLVPNKAFFEDNALVIKTNGELVLGKGAKQFILNYHDFNGNPQSKIASLSTNCTTRGLHEDETPYTCSNANIPNTKFHLLALLSKEKTIKTKECLQQYFSSYTYPINGIDSLLFSNDMDIVYLKFVTEEDTVFFYQKNHRIVIDYNALPMQDKFTLKAKYTNGNEEIIAKSQTINVKKLITYALNQGYSKEDIFRILMTDYLYPLDTTTMPDKAIFHAIINSLKE